MAASSLIPATCGPSGHPSMKEDASAKQVLLFSKPAQVESQLIPRHDIEVRGLLRMTGSDLSIKHRKL
jgi:hypothetical protein